MPNLCLPERKEENDKNNAQISLVFNPPALGSYQQPQVPLACRAVAIDVYPRILVSVRQVRLA